MLVKGIPGAYNDIDNQSQIRHKLKHCKTSFAHNTHFKRQNLSIIQCANVRMVCPLRNGLWVKQLSISIKHEFRVGNRYSCPAQIAKFMRPTWDPPGSCRPQMGPMLAPWALPSGWLLHFTMRHKLNASLAAQTIPGGRSFPSITWPAYVVVDNGFCYVIVSECVSSRLTYYS